MIEKFVACTKWDRLDSKNDRMRSMKLEGISSPELEAESNVLDERG